MSIQEIIIIIVSVLVILFAFKVEQARYHKHKEQQSREQYTRVESKWLRIQIRQLRRHRYDGDKEKRWSLRKIK